MFEELLLLDDIQVIEDYLVYQALQKELLEKKQLYSCVKFSIHSIADENFKNIFRFDKQDILTLHVALQMPDRFETIDQHIIGGIEGLCLLLRRFSYPISLKELQNDFGLQYSSISKLLKVICNFVYDKWISLLSHFDNNKWLNNEYLQKLARSVYDKGAPLTNCVGFIDGTARNICRSQRLQNHIYNRHKRVQRIKFQAIVLPNGIIVYLSPPYHGSRHDAFILNDTLILDQLKRLSPHVCLYGDKGYPSKPQLIRPYSNSVLTPEQHTFNNKMAKIRQNVEWSFGKVIQNFAFVDFKKNKKILLQPLGKYYAVATLLTNAHTCFYGSTTSNYFNIESPNIFCYFQ